MAHRGSRCHQRGSVRCWWSQSSSRRWGWGWRGRGGGRGRRSPCRMRPTASMSRCWSWWASSRPIGRPTSDPSSSTSGRSSGSASVADRRTTRSTSQPIASPPQWYLGASSDGRLGKPAVCGGPASDCCGYQAATDPSPRSSVSRSIWPSITSRRSENGWRPRSIPAGPGGCRSGRRLTRSMRIARRCGSRRSTDSGDTKRRPPARPRSRCVTSRAPRWTPTLRTTWSGR